VKKKKGRLRFNLYIMHRLFSFFQYLYIMHKLWILVLAFDLNYFCLLVNENPNDTIKR